jgi:hypothetical protein
MIDGQTYQRGSRFEAFADGFRDGVFVTAGHFDNSGVDRLVVGAGGGVAFDEPVLRELDASGGLLHDYVYAFDAGYHGGVAVSTVRSTGNGLDSILADPVGDHTQQLQALDATFARLGGYTAPDAASFQQNTGNSATLLDLFNQKLTDWNNLAWEAYYASLNGFDLNGLADIGF